MKNYITLSEAEAQNLNISDYSYKKMNEELKELKNFDKVSKLVPLVFTSFYDDKTHFEHITVFIEYKGILLKPCKPYNGKSYTFYLVESLHLQNFNHNLIAPKKVGVPTEKKLNEWLIYLQSIEALKVAKNNERNDKEKEFLSKIEKSGLKVLHQSNNGKRGYIETDTLEFFFEILNDGYINQQIRLKKAQTFDNFLELIK